MKALCLVAHPDDCVIFAYGFIHSHPKLEWTICYLTYTEHDSRGQELMQFWNQRSIHTQFLGYVDDYRDIEHEKISFDTVQAEQAIHRICHAHDLILTHDAKGDYGHIHHKFVHDSVPADHRHVITFAAPGLGTDTYTIPDGAYRLDELPLHGHIILGFHYSKHVNSYSIAAVTKDMLYKKHN